MLADFAYSEWPEAANYGSISDTASRWRYQLPNRSALMKLRRIRIISRYCIHKLAVGLDGLDPCNGFIIRHFIGVLCHGHQLVIDDSAAVRSELVHSILSDDSASSSCSTPAAHGSGTSIDLDSSSPLRTASNRRCARTALEIAFPDMIYSTAFGACSISNSSLIPEPAIRWPMIPRKLISTWKAPYLSIRRRIGLLAVTVVWLTISTTVAVQYIGASNIHVFICIYCEDLR